MMSDMHGKCQLLEENLCQRFVTSSMRIARSLSLSLSLSVSDNRSVSSSVWQHDIKRIQVDKSALQTVMAAQAFCSSRLWSTSKSRPE